MKALAAWVAGLAALVVPSLALAQQERPYYYGHMWDGGWHGWFFGPLFMLFFLVAAVVAVVLLLRWLGPHHGPAATTGKAALDILKERFARGEIDKEEFEERRRVLGD
jgi:putative membrane protein